MDKNPLAPAHEVTPSVLAPDLPSLWEKHAAHLLPALESAEAFPHNAHIHLPPNFSAFASVADAVGRAHERGLKVLGVSNYYDFNVYLPFARECLAQGILPLFGLEIMASDEELLRAGVRANDPKNPGKVYLCGKGLSAFEKPSARALSILDKIRAADAERMEKMARKTTRHLQETGLFKDTPGAPSLALDAGTLRAAVAKASAAPEGWVVLQERHLARALGEALEARNDGGKALSGLLGEAGLSMGPAKVQNELRNAFLKAGKPGYEPESAISAAEAVELIRELGGTPVYPLLGDAVPGLTELERDPALFKKTLGRFGIEALEWIPTRNSPDYLVEKVAWAGAEGFPVTAGTEHNTPEMEDLLPSTSGGGAIPMAAWQAFCRGALFLLHRQTEGFRLRREAGGVNPSAGVP